ncbi:PREDICTED: LOW QUALITY PROTEIN: lysosomal alpha-glucosidase-like [Priapulus caudatus]|uniref:LOW QUALITY PROTEIN: lysosomal alpha-glucosidase-like n=1 Tax=Priapulus caudatus TaxID=37621 RepID=A0ABM1EK73_PRICU|nr:PREDICTED: LOW QUALITY PROTEIN: lysosomal alpha-glucosidase-like [Priapulus caudatus]
MASTVKYAPLRSSSEVEVDQCSLKVKGPSSYHTQLKPRSSSSWSLFRVLALLLTITGVVVLCVQFNLLWYMTNFLRGATTGNDPDDLHAGKIDFFSWMTSDAKEGDERTPPVCPWVPATLKFDCYPEGGVTQEKCETRGCCWVIPDGAAGNEKPAENGSHWKVPLAEPYCYYPEDYPSYSMSDVRETATGYEAKLVRGVPSYYPDDILSLKLQVKLESRTRLHFKIFDPKQKRYEVPIETPDVSSKADVTDYAVNFTANPFSIIVTRKTTGATLANIQTYMNKKCFLVLKALAVPFRFVTMSMENSNLYGVHPFYMVMEEDGNSFGVFLLNSNAQADSEMSAKHRVRHLAPPSDTQWNDIDYMTRYLDFTLNTANYSELPKIIDDLHAHNQHYVMIVDVNEPTSHVGSVTGCSNDSRWDNPPYVPGGRAGQDVNEPTSHVGSVTGCSNDSRWDNPPYVPGVTDDSLQARTLCPSAKQYGGRHYDLHSLYGLMEMKATYNFSLSVSVCKTTLSSPLDLLPVRANMAATGSADKCKCVETHVLLHHRHPQFLDVWLPLIGADICGFNGNTTRAVCQRWMQLGAFYPFSRNHNSLHMSPQDPAVFGAAMQSSSRAAMTTRYLLLPYLYTQFHHAHSTGRTVATPLFFAFPKDKQTYDIDRQFLWGDALLISPVLTENTTSVLAYLPRATWYDFYTGRVLPSSGRYVTLDAPMDTINLHVREGRILPTQEPALTTVDSRKNKFGLLVALASNGVASGDLTKSTLM